MKDFLLSFCLCVGVLFVSIQQPDGHRPWLSIVVGALLLNVYHFFTARKE